MYLFKKMCVCLIKIGWWNVYLLATFILYILWCFLFSFAASTSCFHFLYFIVRLSFQFEWCFLYSCADTHENQMELFLISISCALPGFFFLDTVTYNCCISQDFPHFKTCLFCILFSFDAQNHKLRNFNTLHLHSFTPM